MISKAIQNELLSCVRKYIFECINKEINEEGTSYFGETITNLIIESLKGSGIDISYCRSQTYDGTGNMVGKQNGAARNFKRKKNIRMIEHYIITMPLTN